MSHLETQFVVTEASARPSEPLPQVKSDTERKAIEAMQNLDLRPASEAVKTAASAPLLTNGGEQDIIQRFNQTYEAGVLARREARREQDERDEKANKIYEQNRVIEQATQEINAAKQVIAAAQDRIAFAQRRIAELN